MFCKMLFPPLVLPPTLNWASERDLSHRCPRAERIRRLIMFAMCLIPILFGSAVIAQDIHGLKAEYFKGREFEESVFSQVEPNIDWYWGEGSPNPRMPKDHFSVRWSGWLKCPQKCRCKLIVAADDGVRLKLDGKLIMDRWKGGYNLASAEVLLTGQPQKIELEYFEIDSGSLCKLAWQFPNQSSPIAIPIDALFVDLPDSKPVKKASKRKQLDQFSQGLVVKYFERDGKPISQNILHRLSLWCGDWPPIPGAPHDFKARISGVIVPPKSGEYRFSAFADDKLRVWINGQMMIDAAIETGLSEGSANLIANAPNLLILEFDDLAHGANFYLNWMPPGEATQQVIPIEYLFPSESDFRNKEKAAALNK